MNQEISRRISFLGFVTTCGIVLYHCGPSPAVPSVGLDQVCFDAISNFFTNTATLAMSYFFCSDWLFAVSEFIAARLGR